MQTSKFLYLLAGTLLSLGLTRQSRACSAPGLSFGTQAQLEEYVRDYPCAIDTIDGYLRIGPYVNTLEPLLGLRYIAGGLDVPSGRLISLRGLDSLQEVDQYIVISSRLASVEALGALRSVGRYANLQFRSIITLRGINLSSPSLETLAGLDHPIDLHGGDFSIQGSDLRDVDALNYWINLGGITIYNTDSLRQVNLPGIRKLSILSFSRNNNLSEIAFPNLDTITTLDIIPSSTEFTSAQFPAGITLAPGLRPGRDLDSVRDAKLDIRGETLTDLHLGAFRVDPRVRQLTFKLTAPVSNLPNLSGHNWYEVAITRAKIDGELDLSGPRSDRRWLLGRPRISIQDLDRLDKLVLPNGPGPIYISGDSLLEITTYEDSLQYSHFQVRDASILQEIDVLDRITSLNYYGELNLNNLPNFDFRPGDLSALRRTGSIFIDQLPNISALPRFESLDTVLSVNLQRSNLAEYDTLFKSNQTVLMFGMVIQLLDIPEDEPTNLHINTLSDTLTKRGRWAEVYDNDRRTIRWVRSGIRIIPAQVYPLSDTVENFAPLVLSGFSDLQHVSQLQYAGFTDDNPPSGDDWLPALQSASAVQVGQMAGTRLHLPERIQRLVSPGDVLDRDRYTPDFSLELREMPHLEEASALCPLVRSGTIAEYIIDDVAPPFDTRSGLLNYCDTLSSITSASDEWQAFSIYPTVQRPGGVVNVSGLDHIHDDLQYRLYDHSGRVVRSGTLIQGSVGRPGIIDLPNQLAKGSYWLTVVAPTTGQRGTGVVVVGAPQP